MLKLKHKMRIVSLFPPWVKCFIEGHTCTVSTLTIYVVKYHNRAKLWKYLMFGGNDVVESEASEPVVLAEYLNQGLGKIARGR